MLAKAVNIVSNSRGSRAANLFILEFINDRTHGIKMILHIFIMFDERHPLADSHIDRTRSLAVCKRPANTFEPQVDSLGRAKQFYREDVREIVGHLTQLQRGGSSH